MTSLAEHRLENDFDCFEFAEKYPEIKQLFGSDQNMKWKVTLLVVIQFCMLPIVGNMRWPYLLLLAYFFGGVINHALMLGNHLWNQWREICSN